MLSRFSKASALKTAGIAFNGRLAMQQARGLATVGDGVGSAGRVMPEKRARATPVSHDRATFTIRVSEIVVLSLLRQKY